MAYDSTKPAGSDTIAASDDTIRANFAQIVANIDNEHVWHDSTAASCIHNYTLLKKYVGVTTRLMDAADGDVDVTGIGFTPHLIQFYAFCNTGDDSTFSFSIGGYDGTNNKCVSSRNSGAGTEQTFANSADYCIYISSQSTTKLQRAAVSATASGQFTLTWDNVGSPASAIVTIFYTCLGFQTA